MAYILGQRTTLSSIVVGIMVTPSTRQGSLTQTSPPTPDQLQDTPSCPETLLSHGLARNLVTRPGPPPKPSTPRSIAGENKPSG